MKPLLLSSRTWPMLALALSLMGCNKTPPGPAPSAVAVRAHAERTVKDHLRGQTLEERAAAALKGDEESLKILCLIAQESWLPTDLRQPAEEVVIGGGLALLPRLFAQDYPNPSNRTISRLIQENVARNLKPGSADRLRALVEIGERLDEATGRTKPPLHPEEQFRNLLNRPAPDRRAQAEIAAEREKLKPYLSDPDPALQLYAALLVGGLKGTLGAADATLTLDEVAQLLKSAEPVVRRVAIASLTSPLRQSDISDPYHTRHRDLVLAGLDDPDRMARGLAARALGKIVHSWIHGAVARAPEKWFEARDQFGGKRLAVVLGEVLEDAEEREKLAIVEQLGDLDLYSQGAVPALARTLKGTGDPDLARTICDTLKKIGPTFPACEASLRDTAANHPLRVVREYAAEMLRDLNPP